MAILKVHVNMLIYLAFDLKNLMMEHIQIAQVAVFDFS